MTPLIPEGGWKPVGIDDLEPAAWDALRHGGSACLIAGPGAGKTEVLAQKACYLLSTGRCPQPSRILAIAFKTDAAKNLARRVEERAPEHARRFQSLTFDAFTKGLFDRFRAALPTAWQRDSDYALNPRAGNRVGEVLDGIPGQLPNFRREVQAISRKTFLSTTLGPHRLPSALAAPSSAKEAAIYAWWKTLWLDAEAPTVEFTMINRLAELIVRTNPQIQQALRLTYPVVFVDEFQDTSYAQYDFLRSVFDHPGIAVTAVGDEKQSIMRWAGAKENAFDEFTSDFKAKPFPLRMNYRSSEALIEIQHVVARALDPAAVRPRPGKKRSLDESRCEIWRFATPTDEAAGISDWIADDMSSSGRMPGDYALLARQKTETFEARFAPELGRHGIGVRNDALYVGRIMLQDLLVDDTANLIVNLLRLGSTSRNPAVWSDTSGAMTAIRGIDHSDEHAARAVSDELSALVRELRGWTKAHPPSEQHGNDVVDLLMTRIDREALARAVPAYRTGDLFAIVEEAVRKRLAAAAASSSTWNETCDGFLGLDAVPLMTVHKSKGLEYHTVIFVGIDDDQWWTHQPGEFDGLATFFVGLTRAEQRVFFTYCPGRGTRIKVNDLYHLLDQGGVQERLL